MALRKSLLLLSVCTLLGGAAFYSMSGQGLPEASEAEAAEKPAPASPADKRTSAEILAAHDLQLAYGKENAPVTVAEYFSLSCPHCADFYKKDQPKLLKKYVKTGKVRFLLRYFPHNAPGLAAAMLMQCVEEGRRLKFLRALFNTQETWAFTEDFKQHLQSIAQIGGIGAEDFDRCLADKTHERKILTQRQEAVDILKVEGIPTIFVNGKKLKDVDYGHLAEAIDAELEAAEE